MFNYDLETVLGSGMIVITVIITTVIAGHLIDFNKPFIGMLKFIFYSALFMSIVYLLGIISLFFVNLF